jgi:hypothetical protein
MSPVLTAASTVACAHKGKVAATGSPRLTVTGAGVLTVAGVVGGSIPPRGPDSCTLVEQANPPTKKCAKVDAVTAGMVPRLTVDGQPVLAQAGFAGITDGTVAGVKPQPGLTALANQTTLTAG